MLSFERRNAICDIVEKQGRADIAGLVKLFGVSAETIRKDLILLEKNRHIRRVHGGVIPYGGRALTLGLSERLDVCRDKKAELCRLALDLIENGDWIFLDAGSTTSELIPLLAERFTGLHIVTYYLPVARLLGNVPGFEIYMCGGKYDPAEDMFYGDITLSELSSLRVGKSFICPSGISLASGATSCHYSITASMQTAATIGDKVYVLADSEKFEKTGNFKLFDLDAVDAVITDGGLDDGIFDLYTEKGIRIVRG